jgi:hypothetical protein
VNSEILLTIGYSTLADRAQNIRFIKGVKNLVIVQNLESLPLPNFPAEISVLELKNRGVAKSRNAAIANATGKYLLFGDDDLEFHPSGIEQVISYLEAHHEISIILAQAVNEKGLLRKPYPKNSHPLKLRNSAKAATYEIFIRVADFKKLGIGFDENFGAGALNYLGDEYILIADALRAGLKGTFLPIVVATHPADSSGNLRNSRADISARAKVFTRVFGIWAIPMRLAFLVKPPVKKFGALNSIRFIFGK